MANKALDFDGASGLVTVSDAVAIQNIFDGGGTFECWINARSDGKGDGGRIVTKSSPALHVLDEATGKVKLRFYHFFSGDNGIWITTSTEVDLNTWTHIVVTYNSSATANDPIIYVNSSPVALTESTTPTETRETDVNLDLIIGNQAADNKTFDGTIDEVRLYTRILAQAEVTANYNSGKGRYWPSNMNNLVAWWHMDEGSGLYIYDRTNRGNTGTITTAAWVDGFDFKNMTHVPRV